MNKSSYRFGIIICTAVSFLGRALSLITGIILAKTFLPEILGRFVTAQALVFIGIGFVNLGIGQGYRQIVSRDPSLRKAYFLPVIVIRIITICTYLLGLLVYLKYVGRLDSQCVIVVCSVLLLQLIELFQIDLQISRSYFKVVAIVFSNGAVLFISAALAWWFGADYQVLLWSYGVLTVIVVVSAWLLARPELTSLFNFEYSKLLKVSLPFAASIFAYWFTGFWGITYIGELLGKEQAGIYSIPLKFYQATLVLVISINGVTLPLFHKLAADKDFEYYAHVFRRLINGLWFAGVPIAAACIFIPEFLIKVVAKPDYLVAASFFPIIGISIVNRLIAVPAGNLLESVDKQWYRVAVQGIGVVICVVSLRLLLPVYGIYGAAIALLLVDSWILVGYWVTARLFLGHLVSFRSLVLPYVVMALSLVLVWNYIPWSGGHKLVIILLVWGIYAVLCLGIKDEVIAVFQDRFSKTRAVDVQSSSEDGV